jgi:hypothetical protein
MTSVPALDPALVRTALPHVHDALEHLLEAWNAVHEVEKLVGFEITTDELSDLAGGLDDPKSLREIVAPAHVQDWLAQIRSAPK